MARNYEQTPQALAVVHEVVWTDVALLYQRWTTFRHLYLDTTSSQHEVLHWAAAGFFELLHRILIDDLLLGIARLADPASTLGRSNLVLESLTEHLPSDADEDLAKRVRESVQQFQSAAAFARPVRNKRLAHRDLAVATGVSTELNYGFTWKQLENALALAAEAVNAIESHYEGRTTFFADFIHHKGAEGLVRRLETAKKDRDEYYRGKLNPEP